MAISQEPHVTVTLNARELAVISQALETHSRKINNLKGKNSNIFNGMDNPFDELFDFTMKVRERIDVFKDQLPYTPKKREEK